MGASAGFGDPTRHARTGLAAGWLFAAVDGSHRLCWRIVVPLIAFVLCAPSPALAFRTGRNIAVMSETARVRFRDVPIHYRINYGSASELRSPAVEEAVRAALGIWGAPECSGVLFAYDGETSTPPQPGDGVSTIGWIDHWVSHGFPPDSAGSTDVQYVREFDGTWRIEEADIYLNGEFSWSTGASPSVGARDVAQVVAHEVGHMIGLLHPCEVNPVDGGRDGGGAETAPSCSVKPEVAGALMYPAQSARAPLRLSEDDRAGVCYLYPRVSCENIGCPKGQQCVDGVCQQLCFGEICASGTTCSVRGCRTADACRTWNCVGFPCLAKSDCGSSEFCREGRCMVGAAPEGDPCSRDDECAGGVCTAEGDCATACHSDAECVADDAEGACSVPTLEASHGADLAALGAVENDAASYSPVGLTPAGVCARATLALGATCEFPMQCSGHVCLEGAEPHAVCSRLCGASLPRCPTDWTCTAVEGQDVCVPDTPPVLTGGGCAVRPGWAGRHEGSHDERRTRDFGVLAVAVVATLRRMKPARSIRSATSK